jgi:hypothetical protein
VVNIDGLRLRGGPGTEYPIYLGLSLKEELEVKGQAYDTTWLLVVTAQGREGWVSASLVTLGPWCEAIPPAVIPPTPISTPTHTPVATSTPTPLPVVLLPLSMDAVVEGTWCAPPGRWVARVRIAAAGGDGSYTYYRDTERIHGPTTSAAYVYHLV